MARCASARQPRRCGDRRLSWLDATATLEERDAGERGRFVHQLIPEGRVAGFLRAPTRVRATVTPNSTPASRISPTDIRTGKSVPDSPPDPFTPAANRIDLPVPQMPSSKGCRALCDRSGRDGDQRRQDNRCPLRSAPNRRGQSNRCGRPSGSVLLSLSLLVAMKVHGPDMAAAQVWAMRLGAHPRPCFTLVCRRRPSVRRRRSSPAARPRRRAWSRPAVGREWPQHAG